MISSHVPSALGAAAFTAVAVPPDPSSWEALAWSAVSAVLATFLSWLTKRVKT